MRQQQLLLRVGLIVLLFTSFASTANVTVVNLVSNGSFETLQSPAFPNTPYAANCLQVSNNFPEGCNDGITVDMAPWHISSLVDVRFSNFAAGLPCPSGLACLDLNSFANVPPASITHPLALTVGQTYTFQIAIGAVATSCNCPDTLAFRNISVSLSAPGASTAFLTKPLSLDVSDQVCRWSNFSFDFVSEASDVLMEIASTMQGTACGPEVDDVRVFWKPCIDGSTPPVNGAGYAVECADGWTVTPPAGDVPLAVTGPVQISVRLDIPSSRTYETINDRGRCR